VTDRSKERMLDLLTDEVLFGLEEKERNELRELEKLFPELRDNYSLELTASAIGFSNLQFEPMPDHLRSKILTDANDFFAAEKSAKVLPFQPKLREAETKNIGEEIQKTFEFEAKRPFLQWLGWAFAGLACIALGVSLWANFQKPKEVRVEIPAKVPTISEQYDNLLASAKDLQKTSWVNPGNEKETLGEIVWSETEQKGFLKMKGLAANDVNKESYQMWIFDETQKPETPIDAGVFDIAGNGEVLIPIDAKLRFKNAKMFAITREKRGGVVVSDRKNVVAIAKVAA
jgi:hypothetical protein